MVPILDIIEFALPEHFGIDYGVSDRLPPGVEATTVPRGSRGRPEILFNEAVFVRLCDHHRRFRFTASHEIAHALIHISQIEAQFVHGNIPVLYRRQQLRPYEDPEWQADQFAAALLMPTRAVMALVDTVGADISEVADTFKVSHTAAGKRIGFMRKEGLIT